MPTLSSLSRISTALGLSVALGLSACGGGGGAANPAAADSTEVGVTAVEVIVAEPGPFEDLVELTGTVVAPDDATLSAETGGTLTWLAPLGAYVGAGGVVAQTDPTLARASLAAAQAGVAQARAAVRAAEAQRRAVQAQLELAEDTYRRQEPLFRDSILSAWEFQGTRTQLAAARAQVAQTDAAVAQAIGGLRMAEAGVAQARTALSKTQIRTSFGGTVEEHLADRGEMVGPGMPIVRVVSAGGTRVQSGVPERYATDIAMGSPVRVRPGIAGAEPRGGQVSFVGRSLDPQTRTLPIEVTFDNGDGALRPEMVVRLTLSRAAMDDVIALPLSALLRDERGTGVLVVTQDRAQNNAHVARYRAVELGPTSSGRAVITSGLRPGEQVVAAGRTAVGEGERVRVAREVSSTSPAAATQR